MLLAVILFDPIFQGLAVSLIGGEIAATVLSRVAVPVLDFLVRSRDHGPVRVPDPGELEAAAWDPGYDAAVGAAR